MSERLSVRVGQDRGSHWGFRMTGGLGSGRWRKPGRRKTVDSCPALDVNYLWARGWLRPGGSGTFPLSLGDSPDSEVILLDLRAGAEWLSLSWRFVSRASNGSSGVASGEREGVTKIIPIARVPRYFGGTRPYFVCSGGQRTAHSNHADDADVEAAEAGTIDAGASEAGAGGTDAGTTEAGTGGTDAGTVDAGTVDAGNTAGVVCGRRVTKLYLTSGRFLCRHCGKLGYTSKHECAPWQQAHRRANKLWRRLGNARLGVPGGMLAPAHERLLEEALRAETQATEAGTARLLQLIERLERRRRIQFTL